jgi:hypothetical protein
MRPLRWWEGGSQMKIRRLFLSAIAAVLFAASGCSHDFGSGGSGGDTDSDLSDLQSEYVDACMSEVAKCEECYPDGYCGDLDACETYLDDDDSCLEARIAESDCWVNDVPCEDYPYQRGELPWTETICADEAWQVENTCN